uniref:Cationic amino acid transporter C-terminal domain-containing protein n=1 Tax=Aegilops tauschii subsp. strangulata TaxID=200361 RepID=A0A453CK84_AEGTS
MVLTAFHLLFFAFIIVAGFWNGSARNMVTPGGLAPYGVRGVLDGAAVVYFSYIGYDSASTMAEEIRDPARALPVGIAGSVLIVSALYCLMSVALCVMLPYTEITESAPFSSAFRDKAGWRWASNVVGAGASIGIVASLLVAMLGQARYLCVIARARLVPAWLAKVHPSTGTPMNATIFLGTSSQCCQFMTPTNLYSVRDDIDRNPAGLLPGGQRAHLPPVRQGRRDPAAPRPPLPAAPDTELSRLLPLKEDRREVAVGDGIVRRDVSGGRRNLPLHGTTGRSRAAIGVDGSSDAVAGRRVCLSECVPHDNPEDEVLSEVRHLEPCDHHLLRVLRGALHIHCGGK